MLPQIKPETLWRSEGSSRQHANLVTGSDRPRYEPVFRYEKKGPGAWRWTPLTCETGYRSFLPISAIFL